MVVVVETVGGCMSRRRVAPCAVSPVSDSEGVNRAVGQSENRAREIIFKFNYHQHPPLARNPTLTHTLKTEMRIPNVRGKTSEKP